MAKRYIVAVDSNYFQGMPTIAGISFINLGRDKNKALRLNKRDANKWASYFTARGQNAKTQEVK